MSSPANNPTDPAASPLRIFAAGAQCGRTSQPPTQPQQRRQAGGDGGGALNGSDGGSAFITPELLAGAAHKASGPAGASRARAPSGAGRAGSQLSSKNTRRSQPLGVAGNVRPYSAASFIVEHVCHSLRVVSEGGAAKLIEAMDNYKEKASSGNVSKNKDGVTATRTPSDSEFDPDGEDDASAKQQQQHTSATPADARPPDPVQVSKRLLRMERRRIQQQLVSSAPPPRRSTLRSMSSIHIPNQSTPTAASALTAPRINNIARNSHSLLPIMSTSNVPFGSGRLISVMHTSGETGHGLDNSGIRSRSSSIPMLKGFSNRRQPSRGGAAAVNAGACISDQRVGNTLQKSQEVSTSIFDRVPRYCGLAGHYEKHQMLGQGSFGATWLVEWVPEEPRSLPGIGGRDAGAPHSLASADASRDELAQSGDADRTPRNGSAHPPSSSKSGSTAKTNNNVIRPPRRAGPRDGWYGGERGEPVSIAGAAAAQSAAAFWPMLEQPPQSPAQTPGGAPPTTPTAVMTNSAEVDEAAVVPPAAAKRKSSASTTPVAAGATPPGNGSIAGAKASTSSPAHLLSRLYASDATVPILNRTSSVSANALYSEAAVAAASAYYTSSTPGPISSLACTKAFVRLTNGREVPSDRVFVCKVESNAAAKRKQQISSTEFSEERILAKCAHPCIVGFVDEFNDDANHYLIMEYVDGGDVRGEIQRRLDADVLKYFSEASLLFLFTQIVMGLEYLHRHNILHRDIKTSNLLLSRKWSVRLGDFGFAKQFDVDVDQNASTTTLGTPYYMAPEVLTKMPYSDKADVWATGVVLYELITLHRPFDAETVQDLAKRIVHDKFEPIERHVSEELLELVSAVLHKDPRKRPTAKQVLQTPLIQQSMDEVISKFTRAANASSSPLDKLWAKVLVDHRDLVLGDSLTGPKSRKREQKQMSKELEDRLSLSINMNSRAGGSMNQSGEFARRAPKRSDNFSSSDNGDARGNDGGKRRRGSKNDDDDASDQSSNSFSEGKASSPHKNRGGVSPKARFSAAAPPDEDYSS